MAKIKTFGTDEHGKPVYFFKCPGCECDHVITTSIHSFNNDFEHPTLLPSVIYVNKPSCHSFVKDGNIQFLSDCDHKLKGQTVPLPEI